MAIAFGKRNDPVAAPRAEPALRAEGSRDAWTITAAVGFGAALAVLAGIRHHEFGSRRYNLGNFTQAVWNTAHGRVLEATGDTGDQMLRLAGHVEPILLLFAPLWWLWPSPLMLLTVQALALAAGAVPVFWLARKHLASVGLARRLAAAYLLYPSVSLLALHEFHAVALAVPFLLFATWYLDEDRFVPFGVWAVLAMATKEQIGLSVAGLGLWYLLTRRRYRAGLLIGACGAAWSALAFLVIIPHFSPTGASPYAGRYGAVGGTPQGILQTALTSPWEVVQAAANTANAGYLIALVLPVAGLCLAAPLALIPAVPELAINLLSEHPTQKTLAWQYVAGIVPFIVLSTIYAIRKRPRRAQFLANVVTMAAAVTFLLATPLLLSWVRSPIDRTGAREALSLIPPGVPVSASNYFGAHLAERRRLLPFPRVAEADWIILDRRDAWIPWPVEKVDGPRYQREIAPYEESPDWETVFRRGYILVLRRTH